MTDLERRVPWVDHSLNKATQSFDRWASKRARGDEIWRARGNTNYMKLRWQTMKLATIASDMVTASMDAVVLHHGVHSLREDSDSTPNR
jgi:hypothetical protein